jgi:hypothetical protein
MTIPIVVGVRAGPGKAVGGPWEAEELGRGKDVRAGPGGSGEALLARLGRIEF